MRKDVKSQAPMMRSDYPYSSSHGHRTFGYVTIICFVFLTYLVYPCIGGRRGGNPHENDQIRNRIRISIRTNRNPLIDLNPDAFDHLYNYITFPSNDSIHQSPSRLARTKRETYPLSHVPHFLSSHPDNTSRKSISYIQKKPRITQPPASVSTIVGQSVLFVCLVEGNPAPEVHWKLSGTSVSEAHFGKTVRAPRGSVFRVPNALPNFNGVGITCTATNALGHAEASAKLNVYSDENAAPPGYPRFLNSFSVIVEKKNGAVELECRTDGDPAPRISWFKNSVPLDLSNSRILQIENGNLQISGLVEEDEGKYECAATNDKGTRLSSGDHLLVREHVETSLQLIAQSTKRFRPHFTNIPHSRQIVPPGGQLELICKAVGAPLPKVDWYRSAKPLQPHEMLEGEDSNQLGQPPGSARILLMDLSESINITCVAESSMGKVYHDVQVVVKTLPKPPNRPYPLEIGPTHVKLAIVATSTTEKIVHYLLFWIERDHFDNQTRLFMPDLRIPSNRPIVPSKPPTHSASQVSMTVLQNELVNVTKTVGNRVRLLDKNGPIGMTDTSNQFQAVLASITQLKPHRNYVVWARAVGTENDASLSSDVLTFKTQEIAPSSPPRSVHAQAISNAAVTVYWDSPSEANGNIRAYRVYYTSNPNTELAYWDTVIKDLSAKEDTISNTGPTSSPHLQILTHLAANATYSIRVSAVNSEGEGPLSESVVVIARPGLLPQPQNLTAKAISPHEILLQWKPPEYVDNVRLSHYQLEWVQTNSLLVQSSRSISNPLFGQWGTELKVKPSAVPLQSMQLSGDATQTTIQNLTPDTHYILCVASVSNSGPGVRAVSYARTKKFVPSEPTNLTVTALSSTELKVEWQPPVNNRVSQGVDVKNTRIAYYDLSWRPSNNRGDWLNSAGMSSSPNMQSQTYLPVNNVHVPDLYETNRRLIPAHTESPTTNNTWYSTSITGLRPATHYVVHVRAVAPSGSGERAVAAAMSTWESPPSAPLSLRLFSQILPPNGPQRPPQVTVRVTWNPSSDVQTNFTKYRIRWQMVLVGMTDTPGAHDVNARQQKPIHDQRQQTTPAATPRTLFWSKSPLEKQDLWIPKSLRSGEVNQTETTWNSPVGQFLLGMTYEFRVAVMTWLQVGHESVQLISLDGSAPTDSPKHLVLSSRSSELMLSWSAPDWAHRHGIFNGYEVRCQSANGQTEFANLSLENSHVEWPSNIRINPQALIGWPNGRVNLMAVMRVDPSRWVDMTCAVRALNKIGHGPWSTETSLLDKPVTAVPQPPNHIKGILFESGLLRISWALPPGMLQTRFTPDAPEQLPLLNGRVTYGQFAVYASPNNEVKNWTRHLTRGPVTELLLTGYSYQPRGYLIRVSSVNPEGHEGSWSEPIISRELSQTSHVIRVKHLECELVYSHERSSWRADLSWAMDQPAIKIDVSHFRVNYSAMSPVGVKYLTREVSMPVSNSTTSRELFIHTVHGLRADTAYTFSVRPVMSQADEDRISVRVYSEPVDVHCNTPKTVPLFVQPPWIIRTPATRPGTTTVVVGCALLRRQSVNSQIPTNYQLIGQTLSDNRQSYWVRKPIISLANWSSITSGTKAQFQVDLGGSRYNKNDGTIMGSELLSSVQYGISLKACIKTDKSMYSPIKQQPMTKDQLVCFQSQWINPVGKSLRPPPIPLSPVPLESSDPDAILWILSTESNSALNKPPSDDASAYGQTWTTGSLGKREPDATIDGQRSQPTFGPTLSADPTKPAVAKAGSVSMLTGVIGITVFLLIVGLICVLIMVYRRTRQRYPFVQTSPKSSPYNMGGGKIGLLASIFNLRKKRSRGKQISNSLLMNTVYEPPIGVDVFTANLTSSSAYTTTAVFPPPPFYEPMTGKFSMYNTLENNSHFGSIRSPSLQPERTPMGSSSGSPNGTLYHNINNGGLILPTPSSPNHVLPGTITRPNDGFFSGCNGFSANSLKSITQSVGSNCPGFTIKPGLGCVYSNLDTITPKSGPIQIIQLLDHVRKLKADNGRLMAAEFESIDPGGQYTWEHSNRAANRVKNRYANIIAYDHSRVALQPNPLSELDSDYINANYLDGYRKQNAYIATQGPLPHTVNDFWRMVWEQRSAMIVSMTRLEERARIKCEQYWPTSSSTAKQHSPLGTTGTPIGADCSTPTSWRRVNTDSKDMLAPPIQFRTECDPTDFGESSMVLVNTFNGKDITSTGWSSNATELLGEATYGAITVSFLDSMELAYYTIRTFVLQKRGSMERREVRQLQFTAWPDHGVPNHPAPLLMFLRRVRAECTPDCGPIIVHCSAGVGRTGAFILLDILLDQMRHEKLVDVFHTVSRLRGQRNFMVQTEDQYAFVYEALVDAAASGNTELTVRQLASHWTRLTKSEAPHGGDDSRPTMTGLELEFNQIASQTQVTQFLSSVPSNVGLLCPIDPFGSGDDERLIESTTGGNSTAILSASGSTLRSNTSTLRANQFKNRTLEILPHDANRVTLKAIRGLDGSDYINASYIDGYKCRAAYIATQTPLTSTLDDFWRMVWETGSCLIVRLGNSPSPLSSSPIEPVYWPISESAHHGYLIIDPIATYAMPSYILREMLLTDTRDGSTRTIRQFDATPTTDSMVEFESNQPDQFVGTDFKQRYRPLSEAMLEIVIQVHKTKEQFGMDGPITLHCNFGAGRTGVFLSLALVLERMRYEGVVDMFQTAKLLQWQRTGLIHNLHQYAFSYVTALEYLNAFESYVS